MPEKDALLSDAWNWAKNWGGSDAVARQFGAQDTFGTDKFYGRLKRNTGIGLQDFVGRMRRLQKAYSSDGGDRSQLASRLKNQFSGPGRWGKIKALYESVPQLTRPEVRRQVQWYGNMRGQMGEEARKAVQILTGEDLGGQLFRKDKAGRWHMPVNQMAERAKNFRAQLQQAGLESPEQIANLANRFAKVRQQWNLGETGDQLIKRIGQAGRGDATLAERIQSGRDMLDKLEDLSGNLKRLGIDTDEERRGLVGLMAASTGEGEGLPPARQLDRLIEITEAAGGADVDIGRMVAPVEGGQPTITSMMEMIPGADENTSFSELFQKRYTDSEGNILEGKLHRELRGFNRVYDDMQGLRENQDLITEYGDALDLDNPEALTAQYTDKEGGIDFEAMEAEVGFWHNALDWLRSNPEQKEKFDRITDMGRKFKGIGLLVKGRDKILELAPSLFQDSEGNLRKRSLSFALTIADWGQYAYRQLFEEKNPLAWLGVAAVAIPVIGGLWKMLSGGRRQSYQVPQQAPSTVNVYQQGGGQPGGYSPAVQQARRSMIPLGGGVSPASRHLSTRQWIEQF